MKARATIFHNENSLQLKDFEPLYHDENLPGIRSKNMPPSSGDPVTKNITVNILLPEGVKKEFEMVVLSSPGSSRKLRKSPAFASISRSRVL